MELYQTFLSATDLLLLKSAESSTRALYLAVASKFPQCHRLVVVIHIFLLHSKRESAISCTRAEKNKEELSSACGTSKKVALHVRSTPAGPARRESVHSTFHCCLFCADDIAIRVYLKEFRVVGDCS